MVTGLCGRHGASLTALVVVLEGGARLKAFVWPETHGFPTHSEALWWSRFVEFNRMGFRDVDHATESGGRPRLAVIGDSYALGWGIRPDLVVLVYVFNDIDYLRPVTRRSILAPSSNSLASTLHPGRVLFINSYMFQELYVRLRQMSFRLAEPEADDTYSDSALLARHLDDLSGFVDAARATAQKSWSFRSTSRGCLRRPYAIGTRISWSAWHAAVSPRVRS